MKKLILFALLLFVLGCKKKENDPDPIGPGDIGIKSFTVAGIPNENIEIKERIIKIKLPEGYTGDLIKPVIKPMNDFKVPESIAQGFKFQGQDVGFVLESVKYDPRLYTIIVITPDEIEVLSKEKNFDVTIGPGAQIRIPLKLSGTNITLDDRWQQYWAPKVAFKNKADGLSIPENQLYVSKETDSTGTFLAVGFSVEVNAGEYEASIKWGNKSATLPRTTLKHGDMMIYNGIKSVTASSTEIELNGYNIGPGSTYQLSLENDFALARVITFARKSYTSITAPLPKDLTPGSYKATVIVNDKPLSYEPNVLQGYANFHYRTSEDQPIVNIVTQPSLKKTNSRDFTYYESTNVISRKEDLLVSVGWFGAYFENSLKLVNRATKAEYIFKNPGVSITIGDGFQTFSAYKIPAELPSGQYEAYIILDYENKLSSEKYARILTIN